MPLMENSRLADFIISFRSGRKVEDQDELRYMLELMEEYSKFETRKNQVDLKGKQLTNGAALDTSHVVVSPHTIIHFHKAYSHRYRSLRVPLAL